MPAEINKNNPLVKISVKINTSQFNHLINQGNRSEYIRELIQRDIEQKMSEEYQNRFKKNAKNMS